MTTQIQGLTNLHMDRLAKRILRLDVELQDVHEDRELGEAERGVKISTLQSHYCYLRQRQYALLDDPDSELKWSAQAEKWEGRKKVWVAKLSDDLLPKILDRLERNENLNRQLRAVD